MKIENKTIEEEHALCGHEYVRMENCRVQGSESSFALKECGRVEAANCVFDATYPLWHDLSAELQGCEITTNGRAALWCTRDIVLSETKLYGTKALRECKNVVIKYCDVASNEFGWDTDGLRMTDSTAKGEYFLMRASNIAVRRLDFKGKYPFQYVKDGIIMDSKLDTKCAFWHSKNVTVENSVIIGEYVGWYSTNLTLKNCTIIGTNPFCYCKKLRLVDCVMQNTDRAFERSEVYAVLRESVDSIKNPYKGVIKLPSAGEVIRDDRNAKCKILFDPMLKRGEARK